MSINRTVDYIRAFTRTYMECSNKDIYLREIKCLEVMFDNAFLPVEEGDSFAGRLDYPIIGLAPEPLGGKGVCFNYDKKAFKALIKSLEGQEQEELIGIQAFWEKENTRYKIRQAFPEDVACALPYDDEYATEYGVAFPLYRVVGIFLDYEKLLNLGIPGMKELLSHKSFEAKKSGDTEKISLYTAMDAALELLIKICLKYSRDDNATELMRQTLVSITKDKPRTFHEAAQLSFLYTMLSGAHNYGRMDVYLGDYYVRDIEKGIISEEDALSYVQSIWRLIAARKTIFHGRVIIGGKGRCNEEYADRFALLAIEASRTVLEVEPQLTLRFYEGMNPLVMERAYDCIAQGRTYPMLYNDDINIPAVSKAFDLQYQDAEEYLPLGCGEYVINHRSFGSPNGIINMLKALEVTMRNGYDIQSKKDMGLKLGRFEDFPSFEDFYDAYKRQLAYYVDKLAKQEVIEYEVVAKEASFLFMSMLYDDCIERGKAIFSGGIRYLGGTLETYGNINSANSLAAIKDVVFDRGLLSQKELIEALEHNFEGYEEIRELLLKAPKYGNDDDFADNMAISLHEYICSTVKEQKNNTKLHSYLVVIINNEANTIVGRFTAASPDGRKAGEPFANANNPVGGTDKNGVTAMLNSLVKLKPDIHAGSVQNMKLSRELFVKNKNIGKELLGGYFKSGGTQAMISVLDRGDLERAFHHPEEYPNLMVRVGGFSARFVTLARDVQEEILSRTMY